LEPIGGAAAAARTNKSTITGARILRQSEEESRTLVFGRATCVLILIFPVVLA